jgi:hypothetical protein
MSKRKGGGKSGRSDDDDEVLHLTPSAGFDIRKSAKQLMEIMQDTHQPIVIHLPNVSVEFEPGCTRKEIIDGYNMALKASIAVKPSNAN